MYTCIYLQGEKLGTWCCTIYSTDLTWIQMLHTYILPLLLFFFFCVTLILLYRLFVVVKWCQSQSITGCLYSDLEDGQGDGHACTGIKDEIPVPLNSYLKTGEKKSLGSLALYWKPVCSLLTAGLFFTESRFVQNCYHYAQRSPVTQSVRVLAQRRATQWPRVHIYH